MTAKSDTTPPDFEQGVVNVLRKSGVSLGEIAFLAHGTTLVINALTERKGVKTGLITTEGFRDSLEIARGNRPDFFNLHYVKPPPFVPRHLRREVPGRLTRRATSAGRSTSPACPRSSTTSGRGGRGGRGLPAPLLRDPATSRRCSPSEAALEGGLRRRLAPDHLASGASTSGRARPSCRLTFSLSPGATSNRLAEELTRRGLRRPALRHAVELRRRLGRDAAREIPITMVESGPASGFWGAAELGRLIGEPNVLALDIGGTTAKCSLIENGHVKIMTDYWIERDRLSAGYPIMVPVVDLVEIGNGGGSIAWVDDFGKLHVGPRSAGACPALPATAAAAPRRPPPTPTSRSAASTRTTSAAARSRPTWTRSTARSTRSPQSSASTATEAARGIVRIANNNMINALKLVSLNRGYDPRDFTLVAFGGGGGMHAVALAQELGISKVVIPRGASVFSAWGMMMSDLRRDYFVTRLIEQNGETVPRLKRWSRRPTRGPRQFAEEGIAAEQGALVPFVKCRYQNQEHALRCSSPARGQRVDSRDAVREIPRRLPARIHLSPRRAGRDRRPPPRRLGRGRQARARPHAGDRRDARLRRARAAATSTSRSKASTTPRSTMPTSSSRG